MRFKRGFSALLLAVAVVALDRATKHWAMRALAQPVVAIEGVLRWRYCENTGAAFSALSGSGTVVLVLSAVFARGAGGVFALSAPDSLGRATVPVGGGRWRRFHLFDRLAWGFVVDFIEPLFVSFAVFNVADCFIVLGVLGAALTVLLDREGAK